MKFHLLMNFLRNFRTSNLTNLRRAMWSCPFNWEGNWNLRWFRSVPRLKPGLPWWLSGEESACQWRRHGFDPQSGKIPHAKEQLSLCAKKENVCVCVCVCVCVERERERLKPTLQTHGLHFCPRYRNPSGTVCWARGGITEVLPSAHLSQSPCFWTVSTTDIDSELPLSTGPQKERHQQELDESL